MEKVQEEVLREYVMETQPGIGEENVPEAMTQVDQTDSLLAVRIFNKMNPDRTNDYYCYPLGDTGYGKLKTVKGSQRKGAGTSQQVREELLRFRSESEQLRAEVRRMTERSRRKDEHERALRLWYEECNFLNSSYQNQLPQWFYECEVARNEGHPAPPPPQFPRMPDRPSSPVFSDTEQQQEQPQDGDDVMVDFNLDDDHS